MQEAPGVGLARKAIFEAGTDCFPDPATAQIHRHLQIQSFVRTARPRRTMEARKEIVKDGKVRYLGASSRSTGHSRRSQATRRHRGWTIRGHAEDQYNLLRRQEERKNCCHVRRHWAWASMTYSPQGKGRLTRSMGRAVLPTAPPWTRSSSPSTHP